MNTLSEEQQHQYTKLFTIADADGDGVIGPNDATSFFNRANVATEILDSIWFSVNPTSQPLTLDQFIFYCELLSLAQNNLVPNIQDLMHYKLSGIIIPYARFTGITFESYSDVVATDDELQVLVQHFAELDVFNSGLLTGPQVFPFFQKSDIAHDTLACIWELADIGKDAKLDVREFSLAIYLIRIYKQYQSLPTSVPETLYYSIWKPEEPAQVAKVESIYAISAADLESDTATFLLYNNFGFIEGQTAIEIFTQSGLSTDDLAYIYQLADRDQDTKLSKIEFVTAMKFIRLKMANPALEFPTALPNELLMSIPHENVLTEMNRLYLTISSLREKVLYAETAIAKLQRKKERKDERKDTRGASLQSSDGEKPVPPVASGDLLKLLIDDYPTEREAKPDMTSTFQGEQSRSSAKNRKKAVNIKDRPGVQLKSSDSLQAGSPESGGYSPRSLSPARDHLPELPQQPVIESRVPDEPAPEKALTELPQLPQLPELSLPPPQPLPQPTPQPTPQLTQSDPTAPLVSPRSRPQPPPKPMPKPKPAVLPKPVPQQQQQVQQQVQPTVVVTNEPVIVASVEPVVISTPVNIEENSLPVSTSNDVTPNSSSASGAFPIPLSPFSNLKHSLSEDSSSSEPSGKKDELKRKISQNQIIMHKQHLSSNGKAKHRPSTEQQSPALKAALNASSETPKPKPPNVDNDGNIFLLTNSLRNVTQAGRPRKHTIFQNGLDKPLPTPSFAKPLPSYPLPTKKEPPPMTEVSEIVTMTNRRANPFLTQSQSNLQSNNNNNGSEKPPSPLLEINTSFDLSDILADIEKEIEHKRKESRRDTHESGVGY